MKHVIVALTLSLPHLAFAQTTAIPENVRATNSIDQFSGGIMNEMILGLPGPTPNVVGDTYIEEEWMKGKFLMYGHDKFVEGYSIRYDLDKRELEVDTKRGVKVLGEKQVRSFVTFDVDEAMPDLYINAREFRQRDEIFEGFVKVLEDGPIALMKAYSVKVKRPDYSEAMNVGSRDYKIYKKEELFYVEGGTLRPIPAKKKEIFTIFPSADQKKVADYARSQGLHPDKEDDLRLIFRWYGESQAGK